MLFRFRSALPAAAGLLLLAIGSGSAEAQYYDRDGGPPPFRHRDYGWDGPPRWHRWHHDRRWRDGRPDFGPGRFGDDRRRGGFDRDREFGRGRGSGAGDDDQPRGRGPGRRGPLPNDDGPSRL